MTENSLYKSIVAGLKGHPEALLLFGLVVVMATLLHRDVNPWIACGCPAALYLLYQLRMFMVDKHKERLAELEVEKLEKGKGATTRRKSLNAVKPRVKTP